MDEEKLTTTIMYDLFKGDKTMFLQQADVISYNHYLRWENSGGKWVIHIGCDEGEIPFKLVHTKKDVQDIINLMMR